MKKKTAVCSCKKSRPEVLISTITVSESHKAEVTKIRQVFCARCKLPVWKTTAKFPKTLGTGTVFGKDRSHANGSKS